MPNEPGGKSRVLREGDGESATYAEAWFPEGESILATQTNPGWTYQLVRVSISDGSVKALKSLDRRLYWAGPSIMRVSPDGRYVAYSARVVNPSKVPPAATDPNDRHIYILAADGSSESEVVKESGRNRNPVWTPDGKHILFTSDRSGKNDLRSIAVQNGKAAGAESLVSADIGETDIIGMVGGSFYYTQRRQGEYVHIVDAQGSHAPAAESFVGIRPTWSPDGKSLAFKRHHPGSADAYDLVVRSLETGAERTYLTSLGATGAGPPTWFHDGKSVMTGFAGVLRRVDLKTADFKELPARAGAYPLSPDDKTLYQVRRAPDGKTPDQIVSLDLGTGRERPVFVSPSTRPLSMALSPDGRTLALGWLDWSPGNSKLHIARVSVDGSGYREVFTRTDDLYGGSGSALAWSEDGRSILFGLLEHELEGGKLHWVVMRVPAEGGGGATLVVATPSTLQHFALSPDGSRIAYSANETANELWALDNVLPALK
jgi:Tol biopolymer transport system component